MLTFSEPQAPKELIINNFLCKQNTSRKLFPCWESQNGQPSFIRYIHIFYFEDHPFNFESKIFRVKILAIYHQKRTQQYYLTYYVIFLSTLRLRFAKLKLKTARLRNFGVTLIKFQKWKLCFTNNISTHFKRNFDQFWINESSISRFLSKLEK